MSTPTSRSAFFLASCLFIALTLPVNASAQQGEGESAEAEEAEAYPIHGVGIFLGGATETRRERESDETVFALGLEYGLTLSHRWEIGVVLEFLDPREGFDREIVIVIPAVLVYGGLRMVAGPGLEFLKEETEEGSETKSEFLGRVGLAYSFPLGKGFRALPQVYADFIEGGKITYLYGIGLFKEF